MLRSFTSRLKTSNRHLTSFKTRNYISGSQISSFRYVKSLSFLAFAGLSSAVLLNRVYADSDAQDAKPQSSELLSYIQAELIKQKLEGGPGIVRHGEGYKYFYASVPSRDRDLYANDGASMRIAEGDGQHWLLTMIYEGSENGSQTSKALADSLVDAVMGAVIDLFNMHQKSRAPDPSSEDVAGVIQEAFVKVDHDIVDWTAQHVLGDPEHRWSSFDLKAAQHASSAILSFFDVKTSTLHIAHAGNFRAVLGRRVGDTYEVEQLTNEHTLENSDEAKRLSDEHPDEGDFLNKIGLTRMFGSGPLKWSRDIQERLFEKRLGGPVAPDLKTPPYVTAKPEMTTTKVKPGDVFIMGSPGFWDSLSNDEAVGLVGFCLREKERESERIVLKRDSLPVTLGEDKTKAYKRWKIPEKEFVFKQEDDPALHLARNALGGADQSITYWLLQMHPALQQQWRKDLKVAVITFDDKEKSSN